MRTATVQKLDANGNPIAGLMSASSGITWPVTDTGTTAAAATQAAVATKAHVITGFAVSTDLAGATVEMLEGTTVLISMRIPAGTLTYELPTFHECAANALASVTVDGTTYCTANLLGFTLDPLPS